MNAQMIAERWLFQTLQRIGVPVHQHPAPEGTAFPYITFSPITGLAGGPLNNLQQIQNIRYQINAYDEGTSSMVVHRLGDSIMNVLTNADPVVVEWVDAQGSYRGTMNGCQFRGIVPIRTEVHDGKRYQRNGNEFEIQILT